MGGVGDEKSLFSKIDMGGILFVGVLKENIESVSDPLYI
jgi:hypothetical protein